MVSAGHVLAGSAIHAGVGFAFIVIDVTVRATPARVAGAFVANGKVNVQKGSFGKFYAAHT